MAASFLRESAVIYVLFNGVIATQKKNCLWDERTFSMLHGAEYESDGCVMLVF